ncbi:hypothetical protein QBA54_31830 [Streptomyces sp. B21-108]|uniref:DUF3846 domain-containing protein n=1 Tax=Streptomyces sp. B21-108 TaxID=3039419 RepID=UPI002FF310A6
MNVDDVIAEKIAAARARAEAAKRRRAALAAARQRGLAHRHAQKLRNQASARTTDGFAEDNPSPANDTKEIPVKFDDAILVTEDETITTLNLPANRGHFAEYAGAVLRCTTIEAFEIPLASGVTIWIDEDGRNHRPYNRLVDALANLHGITDSFHGPVLITGYGAGVEPLPQATAAVVLGELNQIDGI